MNANKSDNLGDAKPETPAQAEKPVTAPRFRARAQRVPGETTGSLCRISAQHLGLLGAEVAPGRYQLRCPWAHQHAQHCKQRDGILDNSTILYMPGAELSDAERAATGDGVPMDGGVLCMHEHSAGPHKGVPLNAEVFLSYARACGAPLPDRPRYMVDGKDEGDYAPLLGADLPPQERCDIDPNEASFTFDAEGVINTGELSGKDLHELGLFQPGEARLCTSAKDPASMEDAGNTFDELTSRVSAQLNMPKDAIVSSAAALAKSQGFRLPTMPLTPEPAVRPLSFGAFVAANTPQHLYLDKGYALIADALAIARTSMQSLILAPPRTGRSLLAAVFFPAWLALNQHAKRILVVCQKGELAQAWHRTILSMFPAVEPFVGLTLGKNVATDPCIHFIGARTALTGKGYDAVILDRSYPWKDPRLLSYYNNTLLTRLKPDGFAVTITNREGTDDFASHMMRSGIVTTTLPADLFPRIVPDDADRTTDIFFWHYNQGLPSRCGCDDKPSAESNEEGMIAQMRREVDRLGERAAPAAPDWFSAFLSECCIVDAGAFVPTPDLRGVFEIWYKANHEGSPPLAQFWKMLAEKGYESDRGSTGSFRLRRGLRLAEQSRAYQAFLQSEAAAAPPAQPASFTEFVKKHQPSMSMFRWKEGHWLIMSGLENALTMRESLILAPPRTGRSMLATIFFPAWLMLVKGKQNVVVVCESATAAKDRHREILEKFPAIEPFVGLVLGKTVDAQPRLQFRGPYTSFTGQGFDAIVIDPPRGSDPKLASHYAVLSSRLAPGGFIATITNREGEGDFAQALINFGGGWGQRLQAHLFPDMIPADIDRTTDTYFWQYNQGLPSYYGAKDIAAAPNSPFKKFLADCLTPAASWQLQLIFGRLHNAEPHAAERCYVHIGRGVNGKTTLLNAVARVFQAVRLTSDLKTDAKLLLREPRMAILECADEASDVWLKTMSTSGSQVHITSNHDIKALDKGALRRVKIFAWEKTISEPDPDMEDKIASDPDFLIWLAEGLRRYQAGEREIP